MLKFFFIIIQFIAIFSIVLWSVNHSYTISFEINDLIFSTSSSYLIICFLLFFIIIYFLQTIYFKTKFSLSKYKIKKIITDKDRGYNSFVNGMIALANKDYKQASKESIKISKYLKDNKSLNLLLKSEIYKVEKKYEKLNLIYEEMSHNSHTQNLGYRGLMEHYLRSQDYHHAFIYGEKLFNNNPNIEKIYETLVNIIGKTNNWQQLLNVSDRAYSNKIINKDLYSINKSIAFYEIAKIKKLSSSKESLDLIEKALKLNKNFPPFVMLYFELLIKNNKHDFAKKLIKKIWEVYPHPPYKDIIRELSKSLDIGLESLVKYITESSKNRMESKILLTEASIESKHWSEARKQIVSLLDHQPNKEICLLMSKIEEGESNDPQKVNAWILRSNNGDLSKVWVCQVTHMIQKEWSSVSESGYFNSLVWRDPPMLNNLQKLNII